MSLSDQIKADAKAILSNADEWGVRIVFNSPDSPPNIAVVYGTSTQHHLSVDGNGAPYNGKKSSITVSESSLTDLSYPVRDSKNKVNLKGHTATLADSTGTVTTRAIDSWFPDEKIGIIVCMLGEYK